MQSFTVFSTLFAEERDVGVVLLRMLAGPLGQPRVDRQGGLFGQPQDLGAGLARELIGDQGFRGGGVGVGQQFEGLGDGLGLWGW